MLRHATMLQIAFLIILFTFSKHVSAQMPDWKVNSEKYQYSMAVTSFLNVNGISLDTNNNCVAAFVGDEIRGTSKVYYLPIRKKYLAFLTIHANKVGEVIEFKIYDSKSNQIFSIPKSITFGSDDQLGSIFQAYSIATPSLKQAAVLKDFNFADVDIVSKSITSDKAMIYVNGTVNLNALKPLILASDGASVFVNDLPLKDSLYDFTKPFTLSILSQDESNLQIYQVDVITNTAGNNFDCTNVITANGDGENDNWIVENVGAYNNYKFRIFDANGRVVFESLGYQNDWNGHFKGHLLDKGKYFYKVESTVTNKTFNGSILVLY